MELNVFCVSLINHHNTTHKSHKNKLGNINTPELVAIKEAFDHIENITKGGYRLIVFSLNTFLSNSPQKELIIDKSHNFPILVEEIDKSTLSKKTIIYYCGDSIAEYSQMIARSEERDSEEYNDLLNQISNGERVWSHPITAHKFLILICGELNALNGSNHTQTWDTKLDPLETHDIKCVLNPSHTPFRLQEMREKHKFISEKCGYLGSCSNLGSKTIPRGDKLVNALTPNACWDNGSNINHLNSHLEHSQISNFTLP